MVTECEARPDPLRPGRWAVFHLGTFPSVVGPRLVKSDGGPAELWFPSQGLSEGEAKARAKIWRAFLVRQEKARKR